MNYLYENNFPIEKSKLKSRKQEETLHKPIEDVRKLLAKVKAFNEDLYLCCLFTYCCLLRPHQEIRLLKWEDFTSDLSHIRLSGDQVKSKRNRIVPVSPKIREILSRKEGHLNIFTGLSLTVEVILYSFGDVLRDSIQRLIKRQPCILLGTLGL